MSWPASSFSHLWSVPDARLIQSLPGYVQFNQESAGHVKEWGHSHLDVCTIYNFPLARDTQRRSREPSVTNLTVQHTQLQRHIQTSTNTLMKWTQTQLSLYEQYEHNSLCMNNMNTTLSVWTISEVFIPLSGTVEIELKSILIACRCYCTSSEGNLWHIQLNGYDLERHKS